MNLGVAVDIFRQGTSLLLTLVLPTVGAGLAIGLLVSLFQAVTQIQEQTLTFVPKVIVVMTVLAVLFPWMSVSLNNWVISLWSNIPNY